MVITGYLETPLGINSIILMVKKVIYNCMKTGTKPAKVQLKNLYYQEKCKLCMKGRKTHFEKEIPFLK